MYKSATYVLPFGLGPAVSSLTREVNTLDTNDIIVKVAAGTSTTTTTTETQTLTQLLADVPAVLRVRACLTTPLGDGSVLTGANGTPMIIDSVTLKAGDQVLLCNQTAAVGNGIVTVGPTTTTTATVKPRLRDRSLVIVLEGAVNGRGIFLCNGLDYVRISGGPTTAVGAAATLTSEVGVSSNPVTLVGPGSAGSDLRVRFLRAGLGALLQSVDANKGVEIQCPNAETVVRPADVIATEGQMVLQSQYPIVLRWNTGPFLMPSPVYRAKTGTEGHSGALIAVLHGGPPRLPTVGLGLELHTVAATPGPTTSAFVLALQLDNDDRVFTADVTATNDRKAAAVVWRTTDKPDQFVLGSDGVRRPKIIPGDVWTMPIVRLQFSMTGPLAMDVAMPGLRFVWWPVP